MEEPKMGLEEYKGVYIYAQQVDNKLSDIAFELVGKAKVSDITEYLVPDQR